MLIAYGVIRLVRLLELAIASVVAIVVALLVIGVTLIQGELWKPTHGTS
jgi:hypothetical protein